MSQNTSGPYDAHLFLNLTPEQEVKFREYARQHPAPTMYDKWVITHPVCRDEWAKLGYSIPEPEPEH